MSPTDNLKYHQLFMKYISTSYQYLSVFTNIVLCLSIVVYAYLGAFSRYMADDYATVITLRNLGFLLTQKYWYLYWSGRFSFYFTISLVELLGSWVVPVLPSTALSLWILGVFGVLYNLGKLVQIKDPKYSAFSVALLILLGALSSTPNIFQSLYWQTGLLTYVAPMIIFLVFPGVVLNQARQGQHSNLILQVVLPGLIPFISGGFSETFAATQTTLLFVAALVCITGHKGSLRRRVFPFLAGGFIGSLVSITIMFIAPGNQIRQSLSQPTPGLFFIFTNSFKATLRFIVNEIGTHPFMIVLVTILPAQITFIKLEINRDKLAEGYRPNFRLIFALIFLPIIAVLLIAASFAPSYYGFSHLPPKRVLIIPQFIFVSTLACWGSVASLALNKISTPKIDRLLAPLVVVMVISFFLVIIGPIRSILQTISTVPQYYEFALEWDQRDQALRTAKEQGIRDVTTDSLPIKWGLDDISDDPNNWWNQTIAEYYGLESVKTK